MKNAKKSVDDDDMLPEYDWSDAVRGHFAHLVGCGSSRLASELHAYFGKGDKVDAALRQWVEEHRPPRCTPQKPFGDEPDSRFTHRGTVRGFWFPRDLVMFFPTEKSVNDALREWLAEHPPARPRRPTRTPRRGRSASRA
jgi:hypothetical protein